jgi:hypothetical protein
MDRLGIQASPNNPTKWRQAKNTFYFNLYTLSNPIPLFRHCHNNIFPFNDLLLAKCRIWCRYAKQEAPEDLNTAGQTLSNPMT